MTSTNLPPGLPQWPAFAVSLIGHCANLLAPLDPRHAQDVRDFAHQYGTTYAHQRGVMVLRRRAVFRMLRQDLGRKPTLEEYVQLLKAGQRRLEEERAAAERAKK